MITIGEGNRIVRVSGSAVAADYGVDEGRPIVLELARGDCLTMWPKGTRAKVAIPIDVVYRFAVRREAFKAVAAKGEKARKAKELRRLERRIRPIRVDTQAGT